MAELNKNVKKGLINLVRFCFITSIICFLLSIWIDGYGWKFFGTEIILFLLAVYS